LGIVLANSLFLVYHNIWVLDRAKTGLLWHSGAFPPSWHQDIKTKQFSIPFKRKIWRTDDKKLKENCFALLGRQAGGNAERS